MLASRPGPDPVTSPVRRSITRSRTKSCSVDFSPTSSTDSLTSFTPAPQAIRATSGCFPPRGESPAANSNGLSKITSSDPDWSSADAPFAITVSMNRAFWPSKSSRPCQVTSSFPGPPCGAAGGGPPVMLNDSSAPAPAAIGSDSRPAPSTASRLWPRSNSTIGPSRSRPLPFTTAGRPETIALASGRVARVSCIWSPRISTPGSATVPGAGGASGCSTRCTWPSIDSSSTSLPAAASVTCPRTRAALAIILPRVRGGAAWIGGATAVGAGVAGGDWLGAGDAAGAPATTGAASAGGGGSTVRNQSSSRSVRAATSSASASTMPRASSRDGRTPERSGPAAGSVFAGRDPFTTSSQRCISAADSRPCASTDTSASPASDTTWPSPSGRIRSHCCHRACAGGDFSERMRIQPGPTAMRVPGSPASPGM